MRSHSGEVIDNLVVGTGHAGIAAAMALHREGRAFEVIDVGFDLPDALVHKVDTLRARAPSEWDSDMVESVFPPMDASRSGVEARRAFGSDFVYREPRFLDLHTEDCEARISHGFGGFGNVWGAAMMPYGARSLRGWPVPAADLHEAYRRVLEFVPLSGEQDDLADEFPLFTDKLHALERSGWTDALLDAFEHRRSVLRGSGVQFGRARLAVDSSGGETSCRYCGFCLDGCPYGAIDNPRAHWGELARQGVRIHRGEYALEFHEDADGVRLITRNVADGGIRTWSTRRLFLGTGHLATTRMILRSLGRFDQPARVADSQYFFFPLLSWKAVPDPVRFTLAQVFAEVNSSAISPHDVHVQAYGMNRIFGRALRKWIPRPIPLGAVTRRFFLFQGFLHSEDSGRLELTVHRASEGEDRMTIRGIGNPRARRVAGTIQKLFRRQLRHFGWVPPGLLQMVPPGRSYHAGASFPMGGRDSVFSSDLVGRPAGLRRTHIVDSACFPDIAGSTIAFTIMANADRVVREASRLPD